MIPDAALRLGPHVWKGCNTGFDEGAPETRPACDRTRFASQRPANHHHPLGTDDLDDPTRVPPISGLSQTSGGRVAGRASQHTVSLVMVDSNHRAGPSVAVPKSICPSAVAMICPCSRRRNTSCVAHRLVGMGIAMIDRRQVSKSLVASVVAAGTSRAATGRNADTWDVVVIGAGSFGAWSAHELQRRGHRVALVDAYGPGNSLSSSGDQSRITRSTYGERALYSRWAAESLVDWRALERRSGAPIFEPTGVLAIIPVEGGFADQTTATLRRLGIAFEALSPRQAMARFPQFKIADDETTIFEPGGGTLFARGALQALVADMQRRGLDYRLDRIRPPLAASASQGEVLPLIETSSGAALRARHFVFACGPWLPKLFPEVIGPRITSVRAEAYFLRIPPGSREYEPGIMPTWFDVADPDAFGFPNLEGRGCKVAVDAIFPPADPDEQDRRPTAPFADAVRAYVARRLPGLANSPFVEARVCQYENTDNEHYLIDRHPRWSNVWIAGGGSGHGYKNGPAVGRYVANLIEGNGPFVSEFALRNHA